VEFSRKRALIWTLRFTALTFLITWGTGMLVVLSDRARLVNGAKSVQHLLPLPMPVAIALVVLVGWGPGLAALMATAWESGRHGVLGL